MDFDINRRGFLGRAMGALASLPILGQVKPSLRVQMKTAKLRELTTSIQHQTAEMVRASMNPDIGLVGGQYVSMSSIAVLEKTDRSQPGDTKQYIVYGEAGFGVIYYLDPRGLFEECNTDAYI